MHVIFTKVQFGSAYLAFRFLKFISIIKIDIIFLMEFDYSSLIHAYSFATLIPLLENANIDFRIRIFYLELNLQISSLHVFNMQINFNNEIFALRMLRPLTLDYSIILYFQIFQIGICHVGLVISLSLQRAIQYIS